MENTFSTQMLCNISINYEPINILLFFFQFEFFSVEDKYDTISVYDGSSSADPLLVTFTGDSASQVPLSKSNYLVVIFSSDHDGAKQGFNVTWQAGK